MQRSRAVRFVRHVSLWLLRLVAAARAVWGVFAASCLRSGLPSTHPPTVAILRAGKAATGGYSASLRSLDRNGAQLQPWGEVACMGGVSASSMQIKQPMQARNSNLTTVAICYYSSRFTRLTVNERRQVMPALQPSLPSSQGAGLASLSADMELPLAARVLHASWAVSSFLWCMGWAWKLQEGPGSGTAAVLCPSVLGGSRSSSIGGVCGGCSAL